MAELERRPLPRLKDRTARWQITLNDGVADLVADVEHDLRDRLRRITREGEELVDAADLALVWDQFSAWVHREVCVAASSFVRSTERARDLARRVAELFAEDGAIALPELVEMPRSDARA